jgi:uncharacterized lipoprotein YbaY
MRLLLMLASYQQLILSEPAPAELPRSMVVVGAEQMVAGEVAQRVMVAQAAFPEAAVVHIALVLGVVLA